VRRAVSAYLSGSIVNPWTSLIEAARFGFEAQCVMALRLTRLAAGGALARREANRMVTEKATAMIEAQLAAATAIASGRGSRNAARRVFGTYKRAVHRNRRRLSRTR
jgi:hypothetical protein